MDFTNMNNTLSGHGNYSVKEKILKSSGKRYLKVGFSLDNKKKYYNVHRLVAIAFLANPDNKAVVNHLDGNKHNNNISNLIWASCSENILHSYYQLNRTTNKNKTWKQNKKNETRN